MNANTAKTSKSGEDGEERKKEPAGIINVNGMSVTVLIVGQVQMDATVVMELHEDKTKDPVFSKVYNDLGEQFTKNIDRSFYKFREALVPDGSLRRAIILVGTSMSALANVPKFCQGILPRRLCFKM
jgi:hypothetical protein